MVMEMEPATDDGNGVTGANGSATRTIPHGAGGSCLEQQGNSEDRGAKKNRQFLVPVPPGAWACMMTPLVTPVPAMIPVFAMQPPEVPVSPEIPEALSRRGSTRGQGSGMSRCSHDQAARAQEWTTLVFRNLPLDFRRSDLVAMLNAEGFATEYTLIYLPADFRRSAGFGFAFVNFRNHSEALRAMARFRGFRFSTPNAAGPCEVAWSDPLQGHGPYTERYRNSPVMHPDVPDEFKPAAFDRGVRMPFPAPTKPLLAPRRILHANARQEQ